MLYSILPKEKRVKIKTEAGMLPCQSRSKELKKYLHICLSYGFRMPLDGLCFHLKNFSNCTKKHKTPLVAHILKSVEQGCFLFFFFFSFCKKKRWVRTTQYPTFFSNVDRLLEVSVKSLLLFSL